jgi:hypothetical protein
MKFAKRTRPNKVSRKIKKGLKKSILSNIKAAWSSKDLKVNCVSKISKTRISNRYYVKDSFKGYVALGWSLG